jgi:hypothetical protein
LNVAVARGDSLKGDGKIRTWKKLATGLLSANSASHEEPQ